MALNNFFFWLHFTFKLLQVFKDDIKYLDYPLPSSTGLSFWGFPPIASSAGGSVGILIPRYHAFLILGFYCSALLSTLTRKDAWKQTFWILAGLKMPWFHAYTWILVQLGTELHRILRWTAIPFRMWMTLFSGIWSCSCKVYWQSDYQFFTETSFFSRCF